MEKSKKRVIIDTDTAGDDTQALLLAALSDQIEIEGVTICAGNVEFDYQVENAKYALNLVNDDTTVYEGARTPLIKDHEFADQIHGSGGLGGDLFPDTDIPSGEMYGVDFIVESLRENPGEISLICIAPLTNIALALKKEPELNELVDEVYVMGGNVHCPGNDTATAEFNFWVDPDAAKLVLEKLDITLLDWGLTVQDTAFDEELLEKIQSNTNLNLADFYMEITKVGRAYNKQQRGGERTVHPDSALIAAFIQPELILETNKWYATVDEREGITRGHTVVDTGEWELGEPRTKIITSLDSEGFQQMVLDMLFHKDPDRSI